MSINQLVNATNKIAWLVLSDVSLSVPQSYILARAISYSILIRAGYQGISVGTDINKRLRWQL